MPRENLRATKRVLTSLKRSAIVWILVCGLCALNFPASAEANDRNIASSTILTHLQFGAPVPAPADPTAIPEHQAVAPHLRLLPEPSWLAPPAATFKFLAPSDTAESTRFATYSFAVPRPALTPKAAPPSGSSAPGRGKWLALGIAGVVVAAVGAVAYAGERESICGGSSNPGQGCSEVKTAGLVLMPVGATMAVVGFVMHARH